MSANSRPSDRVRRCSAGATTDPTQVDSTRPNPSPPIIAADELEGEPIPVEDDPTEPEAIPTAGPRLQQPVRGRRLARKPDTPAPPLTGEQRMLLLDTWRRSGLPAGDFAPLGGLERD